MEKVTFCALLILAFIGLSYENSPLQIEESRGFRFARSEPSREVKRKLLAESPYRLPKNIVPTAYTLTIRPIIDADAGQEQWTAPGKITMKVTCVETTNKIVFHRHQTLTIDEGKVEILGPNNEVVEIVNHSYVEDYNFHTINLKKFLVPTYNYTISVPYIARISNTTDGLYRAFYTDDQGVEHRMATTQFESYSAREAFPCFDEPDFKATFTITVGRKVEYNSLTNSDRIRDEDIAELPGWKWDYYRETVPMSTYLVAIVVSDYISETDASGKFDKPVKVYGAPYLINGGGGKYAADASARIISFLENKYVHKYEMPKIDSIGIPTDYFGAGAMENWGLNTYRENYLLFFDNEQGWSNKLTIASILSHELAHQWFGNLITCKWWSQLWLNEGFATYVSFVAVSKQFPEFENYMREMLWESVQYALAYDVNTNEPVINVADSPEEIDNMFNTISYDKGGSIIRMMEGFLGEETLTNGLIKFLKDNAYKGAEQDDLFKALDEQAQADNKLPPGKSVKDIMDTWTLQPGYPLIRVSKISSNRLFISQEIFGVQPGSTVTANQFWEVPLAIKTLDESKTEWLGKTQVLTSYVHDTNKWIVLNSDGMGYYRVLYDDAMGKLIINELKADRTFLTSLSRSQLIDDYFNLAQYKYIPISNALSMSSFIKNDVDIEKDHVVWYTLFTSLTKALSIFQHKNLGARHSLQEYLLPLIESALDSPDIGWEQHDTDEGTSVLFRAKLLDWACALESPKCFAEAKRYYLTWSSTKSNPLKVDIQPIMYCAMVAQGGDAVTDFLKGEYEKAVTEYGQFKAQKFRLLNGLACSKDRNFLPYLLEEALDESTTIGSTKENIVTVLQRVAMNSIGRQIVLPFLDDNFDAIKKRTGKVAFASSVVSTLSKYYSTEAELKNLEMFIEKKKADVGTTLDRYLVTVKNNIAWANDFYNDMDVWFKSNK